MLEKIGAPFSTHWRGELPAGISLVLILVGVTYAYNYAFGGLLSVSYFRERHLLQLLMHGSALLVAIPLLVWQVVGTWRAFRRLALDSRRARSVVGILGCAIVSLFVVLTAWHRWPQYRDMYDALADVANAKSRYTISIGTGGEKNVLFVGEMTWGSADALQVYLDQHPKVVSIEIHSGGGSFQEAVLIAGFVKKRRLATFVRGSCFSACTLVYSAGVPRIAATSARFGFHRPGGTSLDSSAELERAAKEYADALRSGGIDTRLIEQALKVTPPDVWIPRNSELQKSRFVEHFVK
jgi:hypothetical protein